VTVVCWIVTKDTGLTERAAGMLADYSRLISSFSEMSRMASSNLVLASDSSLELRSRPVSICACLARECLISSFSLRYNLIFF